MFPHLGDGTVKNGIIWYIFEGRLYNFFESNLIAIKQVLAMVYANCSR